MKLYSRITKRILLPLHDLVLNRNVSKLVKQYEKTQWLPRKELENLQLKRLKRLLRYAYKNVKYYRKIFDDIKLTPEDIKSAKDLEKIPILKKDAIINHPDDLISKEYKKKDLILYPTGGSTGRPLKLYLNKSKFDQVKALRIRGDRWGGLDINEKHALIWGGPNEITVGTTIHGRIKHGLMNRVLMDAFYLQPDKIKKYIKRINNFKPKVVTGYSNALFVFSKYVVDNKIKLHSPKTVFATAEMLLDFQRDVIEKAFGCKVLNCYGAREVGDIAQQCEYGNMHINTDSLVVEFVKDNKPADYNETGNILLTDLNNFSMPLIRYEIGDLGSPAKGSCKCTRSLPLMNVTKGRVSDIFTMPDGRLIHGEYFTHLFYGLEGLDQFQIIQKRKDLILVKIVKKPELTKEEVIDTIAELLKGKIDKTVKLKFEFPDKINPEKSGKYCFTKSDVPLDF